MHSKLIKEYVKCKLLCEQMLDDFCDGVFNPDEKQKELDIISARIDLLNELIESDTRG